MYKTLFAFLLMINTFYIHLKYNLYENIFSLTAKHAKMYLKTYFPFINASLYLLIN